MDRIKGAVDNVELLKLNNKSSTLPSNFKIVTASRHIVDRLPCVVVDEVNRDKTEARLTVCTDCVILDRLLPFGESFSVCVLAPTTAFGV